MTGVLTIIGEDKMAATVGGTPLSLTTVRIGDGNGSPITAVRTMTDLARRVGTAYSITASARDSGNPSYWRISTEVPAGSGPFVVREIAVFDNAGDMIAIAAHPVVEFVGPTGGQVALQADIVFPVTSAEQVAITLTQSAQVPLARLLRAPFLAVENAALSTPPGSPAGGATYVVGASPTGAWVGQAGRLAQWTGLDWSVAIPAQGTVVHDINAGVYLRRTSTDWVAFSATETAAGLITLATSAEALAGINTTDAITPATLDVALDDRLGSYFPVAGINNFRRMPFMAVNEVARNAPPGSPTENDTFVIGASPTGAWAGRAHQMAQWTGTAWIYAVVPVDTLARAQDTNVFWQRSASGWEQFTATETNAGVVMLATSAEAIAGVNATDAITPATLDAAIDDRLAFLSGGLSIDAFRRLPFMAVNEVARDTPPGSPTANDTFVIGLAPTGAWVGRASQVAQWTGTAWVFAIAPVDTLVRAQDTDLFWQRTAIDWELWVAPTRGDKVFRHNALI